MEELNKQSGQDIALPSGEGEKASKKENALVVQFRELDKKTEGWIQSWNPYHPGAIQNRGFEPVAITESKLRKKTARVFLIAFGLFLLWAFFAPINAGVSTQGTVMVSGYRKVLQHPTGGVVQEILVKEGDSVNEGDVLIRINPLRTQAELSAAELQYINALVTEARLQAERKGDKQITWPKELNTWGNDPKVLEAEQIQQKLFETRRTEYNLQLSGKRAQLSTLTQEANSNAQLAKEGFVSQSQANQVMRMKLESELAVNTMQSTYFKDIDNQLAQIQATRDGMKGRFEAVSFDRDLTSIKAPVTGTIVGMKLNTVGGTVLPNQIVAEVVPKEAKLIVDARVPPNLIDRVRVGTFVDMRFVAFNADTTPVIEGTVKLIGADKMPAPEGSGGGEFYLAQVEATQEGLKDLGNVKIQPGMPVDAIFKTGERTFMSHLLKPLSDKFARAFQSQ